MFDQNLVDIQQRRATASSEQFKFFRNEASEIVKEHLELLGRKFDSHKTLGNDFGNLNLKDLGIKSLDNTDVVISFMELHYENDPLDYLKNIMSSLNKNGVFIGVFLGGYTLTELRHSFLETETKLFGGASPRVIPMIDIKDAARLIQTAGFENPMSDIFSLELRYSSLFKLMHDLRYSGISNPIKERSLRYLGKHFFNELENYYRSNFSDKDNNLIATFEFITITGFKS